MSEHYFGSRNASSSSGIDKLFAFKVEGLPPNYSSYIKPIYSPIAIKINRMLRPKKTMSKITKNKKGIA